MSISECLHGYSAKKLENKRGKARIHLSHSFSCNSVINKQTSKKCVQGPTQGAHVFANKIFLAPLGLHLHRFRWLYNQFRGIITSSFFSNFSKRNIPRGKLLHNRGEVISHLKYVTWPFELLNITRRKIAITNIRKNYITRYLQLVRVGQVVCYFLRRFSQFCFASNNTIIFT